MSFADWKKRGKQLIGGAACENGREEANEADELDGFRRMIDCAMAGGDKDDNAK